VPTTPLVRRGRLVLFVVLCVVALAVLTGQIRTPDQRRIGWAGLAVEVALAPLTAGATQVGSTLAGAWTALHEIGSLRSENARLAAEVAALRQENAAMRPAAQENERLRALLGFKDQQLRQTVAARVIGRDPSVWFSTVLVDRGTRAGVRRNDAAVTADGVVGHVIETGPAWARVLLLLDPRSAVGVVVERSREPGVAEGGGQAALRIRYLARDADVRPGDQIVTSGLGEIYPKNLVVGTVLGVTGGVGGMFQEADVHPSADLAHLEELLIVIRGEPSPAQ